MNTVTLIAFIPLENFGNFNKSKFFTLNLFWKVKIKTFKKCVNFIHTKLDNDILSRRISTLDSLINNAQIVQLINISVDQQWGHSFQNLKLTKIQFFK